MDIFTLLLASHNRQNRFESEDEFYAASDCDPSTTRRMLQRLGLAMVAMVATVVLLSLGSAIAPVPRERVDPFMQKASTHGSGKAPTRIDEVNSVSPALTTH